MTLKRTFFSIIIIFVLISLACSGGGDIPTDAPTALPDLTATPPLSDEPTQPDNLESATVAEVIDGDTIELSDGRRVRYIGINTPEREQPYYQEATEANRQLVAGQEVRLEFDQDTIDQYGRTLAYIWVDGKMANMEIVSQGFANVYTFPPNVKYEQEFRQAERAAREAERGLWAGSEVALKIIHIEANAPGNDNENPNGEWIEIANQGGEPVQMAAYTLKDEANHIYTFDDFTAAPGMTFRLYSGQGGDGPTELYWGLNGESIWNNGGDAAFLRDADGNLVDTYAY
jgi:micrococcal nuclease